MIPILLNLCLGIFKYICASISGLASIGADAANNLTDAITSLLTVLGVKMASTLGGERHANGHGRIEWVVGIVVSCSLILVGWETLRDSIDAIQNPATTGFNLFIFLVMIVSIAIKLFLFFYNTDKSRQKSSSAYKAAAADCISDAVSTAVVTVAFLADSLFQVHIDGWCGLIVSLFILRNGMKSFADISRRVLGEVENKDLSEQLKQYILDYDRESIDEVTDLQLLDYGYDRYGASFSMSAKPDRNNKDFLLLACDLKSDIYKKFGFIPTIQSEIPAAIETQLEIKKILRHKIKEIDEQLSIDDSMRINQGTACPQVVLHINIPFEYSKREDELYQKINEAMLGEPFSCSVKLMIGKRLEWFALRTEETKKAFLRH